MVGLCPAPALRSALGSCTSGHVCLTAMLLPLGGAGSSGCPKQVFSFINLFFPHACKSHLPQEPWQWGAVRARSSGQALTWQSILSANEPGSQGT